MKRPLLVYSLLTILLFFVIILLPLCTKLYISNSNLKKQFNTVDSNQTIIKNNQKQILDNQDHYIKKIDSLQMNTLQLILESKKRVQ
jgi:cell division protein FtsL